MNASYLTLLKIWAESTLHVRVTARGWAPFKCLYHQDGSASAAICLDETGPLGQIKCSACARTWWPDQYAHDCGLPEPPSKPRVDEQKPGPKRRARLIKRAEYSYPPYLKVVRFSDSDGKKVFVPYRFENGKWVKGAGGLSYPLYSVDNVVGNPESVVLFVEGEKDVHTAGRLGCVATTTPHGADGVKKVQDWSPLDGRAVVIIPDNDEAGRRYALNVAEKLDGLASSVSILELPGVPRKGDLSDWSGLGGDREQLSRLLRTSLKTPSEYAEEGDGERQGVVLDEEWEPLVTLEAWDTPEWPGLWPESLERFTDAVSEMNQTPPAQSKVMCISVLSAAAQGKYQVDIDGRKENLASFTGVAGSTGERKSSDLRVIKAPLVSFETESHRVTKLKVRKDTYERELLTDRVDKLKRRAVKSMAEEDQRAYFDARSKLDSLGCIVPKRLLAQDITPEGLASLMEEQGECIALISAEGGPLENVKSRYQKDAKVSNIFLEGFSGDEVTIDRRKDREPIKLANPSLTMGIMTQPGHLTSILADRDFKGRGLLERFLWCVADERIGYRGRGKAMPVELITAYHQTIGNMLPAPGYRTDDENRRRTLKIAERGLKLLNEFALQRLEPRFRPGADLREVRGWATRLPTAAAKLATLSHIYAAAERNEEVPGIVSTEWVEKAIRWVESFAIPMGLKTFGLMGSDPGLDMAGRILVEVHKHGYAEIRKSDFKQRHFKGTPAGEVQQGYEVLVERNYLRRKRVKTSGRTAVIFDVNPAVFSLPKIDEKRRGEEGIGREKKGVPIASQQQSKELNLQNNLFAYKADLDPSSSANLPHYGTFSRLSDSYSGIKGKKGKKGSERAEEASLAELLEGEDLAL